MEFVWHTVDYLRQGGWVMVPLVAVSVIMWTLIVDRLRAFSVLGSAGLTAEEVDLVAGPVEPDREPAVVLGGEGGSLKDQLLADFLRERTGTRNIDRQILEHSAMRLRRRLDKHLATVAILAGVAPLLGLLGTVLGMIETFEVISVFGTGNSRALAGGISVALITTQTGLLVAIPGLLMSNRLSRRTGHLKTTLDEMTSVLLRRIPDEGKVR